MASNVVTDARKQPVSVTSITSDKIALSGARNLSELLAIYVPGYFEVEDQDDTISGFRGLVPDNNSKVMMLLNGQNINTEWFWGLSDAIIHGIDLDYIDRVEVIRGPGSVTLGSGALLGVVNIVTKKGSADKSGAVVKMSTGENNLYKQNVSVVYAKDDANAYLYASTGHFDGQPVRSEGWADVRSDQGLYIKDRKHGLKSGEYTNFFGNVRKGGMEANLYSFDNSRDNYFWERDRDQILQTLQGVSASYQYSINDHYSLKVSGYYNRDDYGLQSKGGNAGKDGRLAYESSGSSFASIYNGVTGWADGEVTPGLSMGGTREERKGAKLLVNATDFLVSNNKAAFGIDFNRIKMGRTNAQGNNFLINEEIQRIGISPMNVGTAADPDIVPVAAGNVNETNTYVKPHEIDVKALFFEDFYSINEQLDVFFAARYDDHGDWGSQVSPRIGALYDIDGKHLFRFTYQTGFRGAVGVQFAGGFVQDGFLAEENFGAFQQVAKDMDGVDIQLQSVSPETVQNYELAYTYTEGPTRVNAILFYNIVEDILAAGGACLNGCSNTWGTPVGTDVAGAWGGNWWYQNLEGQLKQWGLELEGEYKVNEHLTLAGSHAHVQIQSATEKLHDSIYVVGSSKNSLYPEDVTRVQVTYSMEPDFGKIALHYNHTYYWEFVNKAAVTVDGNHMANLGVSVTPKALDGDFTATLQVKNLWDQDNLTPMNVTGSNIPGGVPGLESRTYWLDMSYKI